MGLEKRATDDGGTERREARILQFRPRPRTASTVLRRSWPPEKRTTASMEEERVRTRQNIAAALLLIAIIAMGLWGIFELMAYEQINQCIAEGRRHCVPLDLDKSR